MEKFDIYFDSLSNEKWGDNSDFYDIHIKLGDFAFPGKGWTDLATYCIDDWAQGFIKLLSKNQKSIVGSFYDGSYHYNLSAESSEKGKIQLVDDDENKILKESFININQAVSSLLKVMDILIEVKMDKEPLKAEYWKKMKNCLINYQKAI